MTTNHQEAAEPLTNEIPESRHDAMVCEIAVDGKEAN